MAKHHNARGEQRSSVSRSEFNALKKQVGELAKTNPPRPEDTVARRAMAGERADFIRTTRGNANFETPVRDHMKRLQGRSVSHVASDKGRGSRSPLTHDETERRRRR